MFFSVKSARIIKLKLIIVAIYLKGKHTYEQATLQYPHLTD